MMYVVVSVSLEESGRRIKLANGKRYEISSFQEGAKILDRIVKFLDKIKGLVGEEGNTEP